MVLYEMAGSVTYTIIDFKIGLEDMFKASVLVEDVEYIGVGKFEFAFSKIYIIPPC